jgi:hypothetical protein
MAWSWNDPNPARKKNSTYVGTKAMPENRLSQWATREGMKYMYQTKPMPRPSGSEKQADASLDGGWWK